MSVALVAGVLGADGKGRGTAFTTEAAVRSAGSDSSTQSEEPELPGRKTLPDPEQGAQAIAEKQELMEGLAVGEDTEHQKDRPGRSSARLEC